jgi:transposase|tara:strand:- start:2069 stop:2278 length:210 start_codon:yes stop_codon:yes gene_type:complete
MNIKWTEEDKQFVIDNSKYMKDKEVAEKLSEQAGRKVSLDAVRKMRQKLGIKKKQGRGICGVIDDEQGR